MSIISQLENLPTPCLSVAGRRASSWRVCTGIGIVFGSLSLITLMYFQHFAHIAPFIILANLITFYVLLKVTWRLTARVRIVQLEYLTVSFSVTTLVLVAFSMPVLPGLDAWILAMALGLAIGRIGCLLAGCCHGRIVMHGVRYPWLRWPHSPQSLKRLTFIPVQGFEAILWVCIHIVGLILFLSDYFSGDILVFALCAYGAGRFGLEFLRGDSRPFWNRLSEPQWTTLGVVLLISILSLLSREPRSMHWLGWSTVSLGFMALLALANKNRWGRPLLYPLYGKDILELTAML